MDAGKTGFSSNFDRARVSAKKREIDLCPRGISVESGGVSGLAGIFPTLGNLNFMYPGASGNFDALVVDHSRSKMLTR